MNNKNSTKQPEELIPILEEQVNHIQAKIARLRAQAGQDSTTRTEGVTLTHFTIEFDGGSSCNMPSKGYGEGYGSYLFSGERVSELKDGHGIQRVTFGKGHSANSAEIRTLVSALQRLSENVDPAKVQVLARGDSKIALKWVSDTRTPKESSSPGFREAIAMLRIEVAKFAKVKTQWRGREHSVKLFGH